MSFNADAKTVEVNEVERVANNLAFAGYGAVVRRAGGRHRIYLSREVSGVGWEQIGRFERSEAGEWRYCGAPEWKKRATCAAGI